jgi:hypothetical protein
MIGIRLTPEQQRQHSLRNELQSMIFKRDLEGLAPAEERMVERLWGIINGTIVAKAA